MKIGVTVKNGTSMLKQWKTCLKTNKPNAKWQIIASNDKLYARLKTLKVIISLIEDYFVEHGIELPSYYYEMKEGKTEGFETNQDVVVK